MRLATTGRPVAHRLEQHHAERRALAGRAVDVGRRVVARPRPVDASGPDHVARHALGELAAVDVAERPVADDAQPHRSLVLRMYLLERLEHRRQSVARVEAPEEEDQRLAALAQLGQRLGVGREVPVVDAVRDDAVVEREVRGERADAGLGHDDVRVEPPEPAPQDRGEHVEQHAGREHRVVGRDADRAVGDRERGDRAHARVVGRVQVHDVDVEALEEPSQLQDEPRGHRVDRLRGVAVERDADAQADDLEALVGDAAARRGRRSAACAAGGPSRRSPRARARASSRACPWTCSVMPPSIG